MMKFQDFAWILNADLTEHEKMIIIVLALMANNEGACWPTYQTLARLTTTSRSTVVRTLKSLEDKEIIKVYHRDSKKGNTYKVKFEKIFEVSHRHLKSSFEVSHRHPEGSKDISPIFQSVPNKVKKERKEVKRTEYEKLNIQTKKFVDLLLAEYPLQKDILKSQKAVMKALKHKGFMALKKAVELYVEYCGLLNDEEKIYIISPAAFFGNQRYLDDWEFEIHRQKAKAGIETKITPFAQSQEEIDGPQGWRAVADRMYHEQGMFPMARNWQTITSDLKQDIRRELNARSRESK